MHLIERLHPARTLAALLAAAMLAACASDDRPADTGAGVAAAEAATPSGDTGHAAHAAVALGTAADTVVVYKDPQCGCCTNWVDHMRNAGFTMVVHDTTGMNAVKTRLGVGDDLVSCHTATVGGYVVEGHVPAADIARLLREKPKVAGLAVPGMPMGSPGMEGPTVQRYDVVTFDKGAATGVWAKH